MNSLQSAILQGNVSRVKWLVETKGINPHSKSNQRGNSTLHFAVMSGNFDVLKYFIKANVDLNFQNQLGETPLHYAIDSNNAQFFSYLLKKGGDIHICNNQGQSMLHLAASVGDLYIVKQLVRRGIKVDQRNDFGESPLHLAAEFGHIEIVEFLLKSNEMIKNDVIDLNAVWDMKNNNGENPLSLVILSNKLEMLKFFLEYSQHAKSPFTREVYPSHLNPKPQFTSPFRTDVNSDHFHDNTMRKTLNSRTVNNNNINTDIRKIENCDSVVYEWEKKEENSRKERSLVLEALFVEALDNRFPNILEYLLKTVELNIYDHHNFHFFLENIVFFDTFAQKSLLLAALNHCYSVHSSWKSIFSLHIQLKHFFFTDRRI